MLVALREALRDTDDVALTEAVADTDAVGDDVSDSDPVPVELTDAVTDGEAVPVADDVAVMLPVSDAV